MSDAAGAVGVTTSVPVEVLLAGDAVPVRIGLSQMPREFAMSRPVGSIVSQFLAYARSYGILRRSQRLLNETTGPRPTRLEAFMETLV